ncbi:MAG: hemolysin family protein [Spirochaetia bacterium]|nr:hemolysin family protein [Spirochaetia bacterium]MCF7946345.1 hemolysin family protein [Spirochaetia bacterium]
MTSFLRKLFAKNITDEENSYNDLSFERRDMIQGIVELSDTSVKEIVVPRIDVVFIPHDTSKQDLIKLIIEHGFSRYPVYKESIDNVIGVLYVKDLFTIISQNTEDFSLSNIVRKPFFVPDSKRLDSLLKEFKRRKVHIAIVIDEYGGVSGIVCLEDVIEEIVGDIQDEFDDEQEEIITIGDNMYLCDARAEIEEVNAITGIDLPEEPFETLGGFVFDLFGKIPVTYEKVSYNNLDIIIQDIDGHKINKVKIIVREPEVN